MIALLRRDLPLLRIDGTIKFGPVLRLGRAHRGLRREMEASPRYPGFRAAGRFASVRADMREVRDRIAKDRAFWSVTNVPKHLYVSERIEFFGHVWDQPRYIGPLGSPEVDAELGIAAPERRAAA